MTPPASAPFMMHGAREAMASGLAHIEQQVAGIEAAITEQPGLAFDLAKTLIEAVCRAVLDQRKISYTKDDDLPKLFKIATQNLSFLPPAASDAANARASLTRTLGGLNGAVQGVCELRNECGFASHGSSGPRPALETIQALLAAEAADAIVGFLHRVHRQDRMALSSTPPYEDNVAFNDYLDDGFGPLRVLESEFRASEVLFRMEPETYRIALTEFDGAAVGDGPDDDGATAA